MNVHYSKDLQQPFIADEDDLKAIADLLSGRIGNLNVRAECADDVTRTFKNAKELLAYENVKASEIRRIQFAARSDDFEKRAEIDLYGQRWRGIALEIDARDDVQLRLRNDIIKIVGEMRPWYSVLHRIDFAMLVFPTFMALVLLPLIAIAIGWIQVDPDKKAPPGSISRSALLFFGSFGAALVIGVLLNRLRDRIFPRTAFLIGKGKKRYRHLEQVQWGIVIAFVVSLASGLILWIVL